MKIRYFNRLLSAGLLAGLTLAGCAKRDEKTIGTPANPLVVVFSPAHAASASSDALVFIKKHIETATGMAVELKAAESPAAAIRSFDTGTVDAGLVTLEEYLVAREEYGVRAELQVLRGDKLSSYEGVILTKAKGGAASIKDLSGRKIGFVGPYSVSGFTLPAIYLEKAGVKAVPEFAPSHDAGLKMLLDGQVYAAAAYARQASRAPGLKVLAVTGEVPNEPLVTRHSLPKDKREALKAAFMTIGDTAEGRRALAAVADITGFRPVDTAVYQPLHELLLREGKTVYDLVPGGWDIYKLNQPYIPEH